MLNSKSEALILRWRARQGTIVDATIIRAHCSTKNKEGKRDPEMHQTTTRLRGLAKNTAQLTTLFALSNLWMAHRQLLPGAGELRP